MNQTIQKFARRFFIKVEQISINHDHIHLLVRFPKRSHGQAFLRTVAGQIAQLFQKYGFLIPSRVTDTRKKANKTNGKIKVWKYRPFTRVIQGWKPYQIVRNYIQLNTKEAAGLIHYKKDRLKGLSSSEWAILWS